MEKIIFDLGSDAWHGFATECVWATDIGAGVFRLENTPFFAKGVSYMDTVLTQSVDGERNVVGLDTKSGHSTYRILILKGEHNSALFADFWKPLERIGCSFEHGDFGYQLYAVDVPKTVSVDAVYECLKQGENKKRGASRKVTAAIHC